MDQAPRMSLLEFDQRFSMFKEFVHYDFQSPTKLPGDFKGAYDRILCDPPFLSADCQTKAAVTVRWLSRTGAEEARIIVCTGERMTDLIHKLYRGIKTTTFQPKHSQDRLSNDFRCYANYESDVWGWAGST
ncbi:Protein-lysine N-methyltransferase efm5 [Xanthoria calcicola]